MSLRLPRPAHERMKDLASERGLRAADFCTQTVESSSGMSCREVVTINIPSEFAWAVRQAARDLRVIENELIYTAVCRQMAKLSERTAAE